MSKPKTVKKSEIDQLPKKVKLKKKEIDYEIIQTGSSGNCVKIENFMFDCGLSYAKIKPYLPKINHLFLTHIHTDHIKESTLKHIKKDFPNIKVYGNRDVYFKYPELVDVLVTNGEPFKVGNRVIIPFRGIHDVLVTGFVFTMKGNRVIYCTDSNGFDNAPNEKFDYFFIESNFDEKKINAIRKSRGRGIWKYGYDVVSNASRHCSKQKSRGFYYSHRKNNQAKYIELHQSSRFY